MPDQNPKYWKSLAEREGGAGFTGQAETEFADSPLRSIEPDPGRRAFLKAAGFSFASIMAGCGRAPVQQAMPHLDQPDGIIAGRPVYYASTCAACAAGCGLLVKTRDGRPIKLEGNPEHPLSRGGLCAAGQASILGLYDSLRLKHPLVDARQANWQQVDAEILRRLKDAGVVRVLSHTLTSPTTLSTISQFLAQFRDGRHVTYDPLSCSAILDAHQQTHGLRALPRYRFERAEVVVSFDADFLGTWISPVEFTAAYRAARDFDAQPPRVSWHAQFESRLSITGTKADRRVPLSPAAVEQALSNLASLIEAKAGPEEPPYLREAAQRLWKARGRSLVVCGIQSVEAQLLCNSVNHLLGNYGATLDLENPSRQRAGSDRDLSALLHELRGGAVDALFVLGANPVAELPGGEELAALIRKLPLSVSLAERLDETAGAARFVCPDHHYLESWSDAEPVAGLVSFTQPVIRPLNNSRSSMESFSIWSRSPMTARELVRERWSGKLVWEDSLRNGFARFEAPSAAPRAFTGPVPRINTRPENGYQLLLYAKAGMLDGRHAYNPWLHELPDPITKITWDNYASIAPAAAARLGISEGDVLRIESGSAAIELPAMLQPGQDEHTVAVALGYGRKASSRFSKMGPAWLDSSGASVGPNGLVGSNGAPLLAFHNGSLRYTRSGIRIVRTGRRQPLAATQDHHTLSAPNGGPPRPIVQEVSLADLSKPQSRPEPHPDLWPEDHPYTGHKWAMAIDLDACTGCSACVVACQVENNIPVVGKDEVRRKRAMHWLRIDRYYSGTPDEVEVAHHPMLCQHCDNASCETVCPVLATVHSAEGLNQQIYNRCVGTRYCANNCPYKARRFNWFDYPRDDRLANLVLNPDVTVRSRGVMEKCTFCVQRIQEAKLEAKRRGEPVRDGDIRTACQQSCPAQAIVFGDRNDPDSRVSRLMRSGRAYRVLEEINVRPAVTYLKIVRNRTREGGES